MKVMMAWGWAAVCLALSGFAPLGMAVQATAAGFAESVWRTAAPAVVAVEPVWPGYDRPGLGAPEGSAPEGSGVVVFEPGLVVTAAHVVAKATEVSVRDHTGTRLPARVVAIDLDSDLALLRVDAAIAPIAIAGERPANGADVCAIGNAFGLDISITCGVVSARSRSGIGFNAIEDFIQTDAAVNPGASGGALVDDEGRLVGMLSAIFTMDSDANAGVNFAVSTDLLTRRARLMLQREQAVPAGSE